MVLQILPLAGQEVLQVHQGAGVRLTGMAGVGQQVLGDHLKEAGHCHILGICQVARLTCNIQS